VNENGDAVWADLFEGWRRGQTRWELSGGDTTIFWMLQALRWIHPGWEAGIQYLEKHGAKPIKRGGNRYDWYHRQIYFNPRAYISDSSPKWMNANRIVLLAHEVAHAFHDLYFQVSSGKRIGILTPVGKLEQMAVYAENGIRQALFNVDPSCWDLRPRTGYWPSVPDVQGASDAAEAWANFDWSFKFGTPPGGVVFVDLPPLWFLDE
jgi:hypothetical protein